MSIQLYPQESAISNLPVHLPSSTEMGRDREEQRFIKIKNLK
jgi:hypothetical protein